MSRGDNISAIEATCKQAAFGFVEARPRRV
jgi:hypothetical protein